MEFFKGLGSKISQTSQDAIKKTKEIADTTKLNSEISAEEKKISSTYQLIGQKFFELNADTSGDEFADLFLLVKNSMVKIEEAKEEIKKIKGKKNCPKCGAELDMEILFCSMCGEKMPHVEKQEEILIESSEISQKKCANCNEPLSDEAVFCPSCGAKAEVIQ